MPGIETNEHLIPRESRVELAKTPPDIPLADRFISEPPHRDTPIQSVPDTLLPMVGHEPNGRPHSRAQIVIGNLGEQNRTRSGCSTLARPCGAQS